MASGVAMEASADQSGLGALKRASMGAMVAIEKETVLGVHLLR